MSKQKGRIGFILEKYFLKLYYGVDFNFKQNRRYDLPCNLNFNSYKNVSIKASTTDTVMCGDIFNFLSSKNLEMLIIFYIVKNDEILVSRVFLIKNTELLFIYFNLRMKHLVLLTLYSYIRDLTPPYTPCKRYFYKFISKCLNTNNILKVNCKVSSTNKRIHCSFSFKNLCKVIKPVLLYENLKIKIKK